MNPTISNKFNRIALVVLMGLMTLQMSCKKNLDTLSGTVWTYSEIYDKYETFDYTLIFMENTFTLRVKDIISPDDPYPEDLSGSMEGTYIYNPPNVTFDGVDSEGNSGKTYATISGNQITFNEFYTMKGNPLVLTKQ